jgi:ribosomal protein S18 acetylase RimI-like enzyme
MKIADKIRVRFARADDLAWCTIQDDHVAEEIIKSKIELNEIIISEIEGQNIGYLRLEYLWSKIPYISLILVQKEYRGQGIGRAILKFLEKFLRSKGHKILLSSSQVNEKSPQAWHRAMGFKECGILAGVNEDGIGEVFFRKTLI